MMPWQSIARAAIPLGLVALVLGLTRPWGDGAAALVMIAALALIWPIGARGIAAALMLVGAVLVVALAQVPLLIAPAIAIWSVGLGRTGRPTRAADFGLAMMLFGLALLFVALVAEHVVSAALWQLTPDDASAVLAGEVAEMSDITLWNNARGVLLWSGGAVLNLGAIVFALTGTRQNQA